MSMFRTSAICLASLLALNAPNCSVQSQDRPGRIESDGDLLGESFDTTGSVKSDSPSLNARPRWSYSRTPAMIGDFFGGNPVRFSGNATVDRLFVFASDLDVPLVLPAAGSTLAINEPGPVGIYSSPFTSVQDIQTLLLAGQPLPATTLVGTVPDNATMITAQSVSQIQNQLAGTGLPFDIIPLAVPPGTYDAAVNAAFQARNGLPGITEYSGSNSGAMLQGGVDALNGGEDFDAFYFYQYSIRFNASLADATSGGVGRMKFAEGGTVLPQNRVFLRYGSLSGVGYSNPRNELNRFVPGFERAFFDDLLSVEVRAPFAADATTVSRVAGDSVSNGEHARFGNLSLYFKVLLVEGRDFAVSGGLGILLPTADDLTANYMDGTPLLRIANDSARLQPFVGGLYTPSEKWFIQSFLQLDTAATGNSVSINSNGTGLTKVGEMTDVTNLFLDFGVGYWLYRTNSTGGLTGIIPMLEIHQNTSFDDGELLTSGPFQVSNGRGTSSLTNLVVGNTIEFGQRSTLTAAYSGPLGGGSDRQYNGALQLFLSHGW